MQLLLFRVPAKGSIALPKVSRRITTHRLSRNSGRRRLAPPLTFRAISEHLGANCFVSAREPIRMKSSVSIVINGERVEAEVPGETLLVDFLRDDLGLTGTHIGCDTSQCGACTVQMDGLAVKSCTVLAAQADGRVVRTIEDLAEEGRLHPMQAAFREHHGLQCGFCTPGMIMSALDLLSVNADPSEDEVRSWLKGNICRCTGYQNIVAAILACAAELRQDSSASGTAGRDNVSTHP